MKCISVFAHLTLIQRNDAVPNHKLTAIFNAITGGDMTTPLMEALLKLSKMRGNARPMIHELKAMGLEPAQIAEIFSITPAGVYYHLRQPIKKPFRLPEILGRVPADVSIEWAEEFRITSPKRITS
jgi:hypothetical protein